MQELIKLLNEYWDIKFNWEIKWTNQEVINQETYIISKKFWFIKHLVENNKIKEEEFSWFLYWPDYISDLSDAIIAWLSISETPIEDLIWLLYEHS